MVVFGIHILDANIETKVALKKQKTSSRIVEMVVSSSMQKI